MHAVIFKGKGYKTKKKKYFKSTVLVTTAKEPRAVCIFFFKTVLSLSLIGNSVRFYHFDKYDQSKVVVVACFFDLNFSLFRVEHEFLVHKTKTIGPTT